MKIGKWARLLLVAAPLMAGCGNFWQAPSSTTTTTTTTLSSGYFYLLDKTTGQVLSYWIDAGTLTLVGSYSVPYPPQSIAVAPNNQFLYVGTTTGGIYLYTISSGVLTLNSTAISSDPATTMQVDSTDSWLVEASGSGYLYAIPIVSNTGALNGSCATCHVALTGTTINQLVIAPNNQYIFVASGSNGTAAYTFTAANSSGPSDPFSSAAYATISPANTTTPGTALAVAVDPGNRVLYIGETAALSSGGGLRVLALSTLVEQPGSPHASGGTGPYSILPKSTEDYVYVANWNGLSSGNITAFSISATSSGYTLANLNEAVATGVEPTALAEDSTDQFVLAVSPGGSPYFDAYYFDTTTTSQLDATITSSAYAFSGLTSAHP